MHTLLLLLTVDTCCNSHFSTLAKFFTQEHYLIWTEAKTTSNHELLEERQSS